MVSDLYLQHILMRSKTFFFLKRSSVILIEKWGKKKSYITYIPEPWNND